MATHTRAPSVRSTRGPFAVDSHARPTHRHPRCYPACRSTTDLALPRARTLRPDRRPPDSMNATSKGHGPCGSAVQRRAGLFLVEAVVRVLESK